MKKGGRMQMYLVAFAAYYMYKQYMGQNERGRGSAEDEAAQGAVVESPTRALTNQSLSPPPNGWLVR